MRAAGLVLALALAGAPVSGLAHHLGTYTPRDNEISASFKQIKSSVEARRFDVALRLFEEGAVRREMRQQATRLPQGLETATRAALSAGDAPEVERVLVIFLAGLARNLALEAQRQTSAPGVDAAAGMAAGRLFLEAIWRYYNLIDYAASRRAPRISVAVRLAFDDADSLTRGPAASGAGGPASGSAVATAARATAADPRKLSEPLQRIARALGELIEASSPPTRRAS